MVTATDLRRHFAATVLPTDPRDVVFPEGSDAWPESFREQLASSLKLAGVLVPVIERPDTGLSLLLTQRSAELTVHAGQVSFPGGRMEDFDADIAQTALRETEEEVGIARHEVDVIGFLEPMPTITGFAVTPVVGLLSGGVSVSIDRSEVECVFEVPLQYFADPANHRMARREIQGGSVDMIEYHYEGQRIWGATAFIIQKFFKFIKNNK
jgi:8-oxo-dGTP pyrophosphatase MutT (NUDIX family)